MNAKAKRGDRRKHRERMRKKARKLYAGCRRPERYADNLTVCSGPCCGNPRKWQGTKTLQEIRFDEKSSAEV